MISICRSRPCPGASELTVEAMREEMSKDKIEAVSQQQPPCQSEKVLVFKYWSCASRICSGRRTTILARRMVGVDMEAPFSIHKK